MDQAKCKLNVWQNNMQICTEACDLVPNLTSGDWHSVNYSVISSTDYELSVLIGEKRKDQGNAQDICTQSSVGLCTR